MENTYGKQLVRIIGGYLRPEENRKAWLVRVAKAAGIHPRLASAAWYGEDISLHTEMALQVAAQEKAKHDDDQLIAQIEKHIAHLETVDAGIFGPDIAQARQFLARYRRYAKTRLFADVPDAEEDVSADIRKGNGDDPEGG